MKSAADADQIISNTYDPAAICKGMHQGWFPRSKMVIFMSKTGGVNETASKLTDLRVLLNIAKVKKNWEQLNK